MKVLLFSYFILATGDNLELPEDKLILNKTYPPVKFSLTTLVFL